ncbi:MAG: ATP-binding protein [Pyrinomonadaceae bacterium]
MFNNPFTPGAGHKPPKMAGRAAELAQFEKLLTQTVILENVILTGLRGVGKTVLLDFFRPLAIRAKWRWAGTDMSESACLSEENLATRLITDLSVISSEIVVSEQKIQVPGFTGPSYPTETRLNYTVLRNIYDSTPGLVSDKLKYVLELIWHYMKDSDHNQGVIFAYDEAQNLGDHSDKEQFPFSVLLDVFQSIQKKGIPFMLVLTGLPTLTSKLVESRTFSERMFTVITIDRLSDEASREAIEVPIQEAECPVTFTGDSVNSIINHSAGYPYFIQFICREAFDIFVQQAASGLPPTSAPIDEILRKLDADFFSGRWSRTTDRQRDLLRLASQLDNADGEFTVQELVDRSTQVSAKVFSRSHISQMLAKLMEEGLIFKNRYGKYSFAVPLLGRYIRRLDNDFSL